MADLIERLRAKAALTVRPHAPHLAGDVKHYVYDADTREVLTEAAAALEAAREDAARLNWLASEAQMLSGWREHGTWETPALLVNSTREHCTPADLRSAIDQARGKGGAWK